MAFAINQNFDLKSKRKDFVRQELTLADLKNTRDADYPDDYTVTIGGKIYIFNSANPVSVDFGKWQEYKIPISPRGGLRTASSGLVVNCGIGLSTNYDGKLNVECSTNNPEPGEGWVAVHRPLADSMPLCILVGKGLWKGSNNSLSIGALDDTISLGDGGIAVRLGSGLMATASGVGVNLSTGLYCSSENDLCVRTGRGLTIGTGGEITLNMPQDEDFSGYDYFSPLRVSSSGTIGIPLGSGLVQDPSRKLSLHFSDVTLGTDKDGVYVRISSGLEKSSNGVSVKEGSGIMTSPAGVAVRIGSGLGITSRNEVSMLVPTTYRRVGGSVEATSLRPFINPVGNGIEIRLGSGLAVDGDGCLYVDIASLTNV